MSDHTYDAYYIDMPFENVINPSTNISNIFTNSIHPVNDNSIIGTSNSNTNVTTLNSLTVHNNDLQRFDEAFWHVYNKFQSKILKEYPDTPCVYCGRLLYKSKATWVTYDPSESYPIEQINQINVYDLYATLRRQIVKIPSCSSCAKPQNRFQFPILARIPDEIEAVPLHHRKYLSPVHLHCSLGRNSNSDSYSEYRSIVGTMGYSKNFRALALYSGIMGAYLQPLNPNHVPNEMIFNDTHLQAASWLSLNNPYLRNYSNLLHQRFNARTMGPFPIATHIPNDDTAPPVNQRDIIIPIMNLPNEVHNEDFHYSRLMAGFVNNNDNNSLPISLYDPNLEPLLFPHLFPNGKGHFHDMREHAQLNESRLETLGKYAKHMILLNDPRFRLDHYWPTYTYLQLEKLRHHQNTQRILRQKNVDELHQRPLPTELLQQSNYSNTRRINEDLTIPIPTFIRTGDSYFHEKELHLNSMLQKFALPTLFITLSMAESRWTELHDILLQTDNNDTIPTNRPLHCALHFIHRFRSLKKEVWKNDKVSGWGTITDFFDRIEFQNRGAAHTHGCYWTTKSIEYMIQNDVIRSDLPDPEQEPELYQKVLTYQIHRCDPFKCGGPAPPGEQCKKGFPRQFSDTTHVDQNSCRYIYKCTKPLDQWVVPYHPETLLIWNAHMNAQYVTSKGFARYVTKYIAKSEPSHIFNITDNDKFREHIIARRLGAMEAMFLILGEPICNSSIQVKYLNTDPPNIRSKAVLPVHLLINEEDDPYFKDPVEKYMNRPTDETFDQITYPEYFERYIVQKNRPTNTRRNIFQDQLGNYVFERTKPIIVRHRFLKTTDGELYFYQLLLKNIPVRSEEELKGGYSTYRDHFTSMYPHVVEQIQHDTQNYTEQVRQIMNLRYAEILDQLLSNLENIIPPNIRNILKNQLDSLKILPPIFPADIIHQLPPDQYYIMSTLNYHLDKRNARKRLYFFVTGSAGTGKSYIAHLIVNLLKNKNSNYLLMAPTGVAAQNIDGSTIHSALRLTSTYAGFHTLAFYDNEFKEKLKRIEVIIIDEISMVSAELLEFISNMFATIHNNTTAFGGISIIVIGDLAQLPPVAGSLVFKSSVWKLFCPLFLRYPHRQQNQEFYNMLQNIRLGNITDNIWEKLQEKHQQFNSNRPIDLLLNTTNIVGYRETADKINRLVCNALPTVQEKFMLSNAIDTVNGEQWNANMSEKSFKSKTNLPALVRLQQGAKVMYLNNSKIDLHICNGTIGVVTDVNTEANLVRVAFNVPGGIIDIDVKPKINYFTINGNYASRHQFPLQNCYALTVHKTQGLTLNHISVSLDNQMFSPGQAYTALSRCSDWNHVQIATLNREAFLTDPEVIREYNRLERIAMPI